MPVCTFLFPNAMLSASQAQWLGEQAVPECLTNFLAQAKEPQCVELLNPALSGAATDQFVWTLITARSSFAPHAPYTWKGLGGSRISQEIWEIQPFYSDNSRLKAIALPGADDIDGQCALADLLQLPLRRYGFALQSVQGQLFAARKNRWRLTVAPWSAQQNKPALPAIGEDAQQWQALQALLKEKIIASDFAAWAKEKGLPTPQGVWISAGGFEEQLLPFTQLRCVMGADAFTRGVSEAAGLNADFITPMSERWPECPEGSRLVVMNQFDFETLKRDGHAWVQAWAQSIELIKKLMGQIEAFERHEPRLVVSGGTSVSSIDIPTKKSLAFWKKQSDHAKAWLVPS